MDKTNLENYISLNFSTRKIAQLENKSQTTIRHWLKKYELKTNLSTFEINEYKCKCGETNPEKFYGHKKSVCVDCHNEYVLGSGKNKKQKARQYLGGCCKICGFDKYACSLDIHHLDPTVKDNNFKSMRGWSWERILQEIETCVLLCKNCHAAVHSGLVEVPK
jgi:hypothetical protein